MKKYTTVGQLKEGEVFLFGGMKFQTALPLYNELYPCFIYGTLLLIYVSTDTIIEKDNPAVTFTNYISINLI